MRRPPEAGPGVEAGTRLESGATSRAMPESGATSWARPGSGATQAESGVVGALCSLSSPVVSS
ncbi:hypothetical protein [Acrocarpospora macrocephala]|uniref:hypothetical protein n=1 Tax=Acrocarpospora macrocephala TaxID=150177 RepID=UPI001C3FE653|nr:hypothetical protein [Acrocarpospora macrocephala]